MPSLKDLLKGILSDEELKILPRSFDIIGDIAIIEIPPELEKKEKVIAEALLKFKNIKVVAKKAGIFEGEFRTRNVEIIGGENRTETIHKELSCKYILDIEKVYFSERLENERLRILNLVKDNEKILVMFAGVGPYAILLSKKKNVEVYAIELNPVAYEYMIKNVKLNKVNVNCILGDVRIETPKLVEKVGKFDRIIMPLPKDAGNFLDVALKAIKKGGIIHYYGFSDDPKKFANEVKNTVKNLNYEIEILNAVKCGSYSPRVYRICVDFKVL
ncbi:MAG: class I SAM-dependent methyltransferase [Candidatus Altarchaeaceae archaeon]